MPIVNNGLKNFRVSLSKKYEDTINFRSGVQLYVDTMAEHYEKVTLLGKIEYAPENNAYGLAKGDDVAMRYDVVGDSTLREDGTRIFHNSVIINGIEQFIMNENQILGTFVDGKLRVVDGYVFGTAVSHTDVVKSDIPGLPDWKHTIDKPHRMKVVDIRGNIGVGAGDTVVLDPQYISKYNFGNFFGEELIVVKEKYLIAKVA